MRHIANIIVVLGITSALIACQAPAIHQESGISSDVVRERLAKKLPGTAITEVNRTEVDGVYEVVAGRNVFYTDPLVRYMFIGSLYDIANRHDLTADRVEKLSLIKFAEMPDAAAIIFRQGTGAKKVAVFSDPDCPYCRKMEPELAKLKDTTIYVYLMPLPMHGDAAKKSASVWCSADRGQAWRNLMLKNELPLAVERCEQPLQQILSVAQAHGVRGTPTLVSEDGRVHAGFMSAEQIELWINKTGGKS
jgi:thiol:disulfide interchange protein DsbC